MLGWHLGSSNNSYAASAGCGRVQISAICSAGAECGRCKQQPDQLVSDGRFRSMLLALFKIFRLERAWATCTDMGAIPDHTCTEYFRFCTASNSSRGPPDRISQRPPRGGLAVLVRGCDVCAEPMRPVSKRRQSRIRIATLDIWPTEVESLVKLEHLDEGKKENKYELEQALYRFLGQAFVTIDALNAKRP